MGKIIPYIVENKKCLKPPTNQICSYLHSANPSEYPIAEGSKSTPYRTWTAQGPANKICLAEHPASLDIYSGCIQNEPSQSCLKTHDAVCFQTGLGCCSWPFESAPGFQKQRKGEGCQRYWETFSISNSLLHLLDLAAIELPKSGRFTSQHHLQFQVIETFTHAWNHRFWWLLTSPVLLVRWFNPHFLLRKSC